MCLLVTHKAADLVNRLFGGKRDPTKGLELWHLVKTAEFWVFGSFS
jgi:hypothetical protein